MIKLNSIPVCTFFSFVKETLPDPILGLTVLFNKDTSPNKINLGVGAYRDSNSNSYISDAVTPSHI